MLQCNMCTYVSPSQAGRNQGCQVYLYKSHAEDVLSLDAFGVKQESWNGTSPVAQP